ncbi:helix-turn-helix domain-containing protein [Limnohabitans planktonicus]|jgi:cytoskeleton protein RodZ|uniref:Helix-turn-helix domain-containing protein n=1 Tax=Limnohabitans planktonicus II-D5 TaxID=1293045 RepID=A0A2T7UH62_9BURK|nr:helix-turn-helix domain-containing protein [Limnohabitans planktonicus]PVE44039.1 helix-turn-helix domain-containing protein [Limnohabitans planktonicus II-D5]
MSEIPMLGEEGMPQPSRPDTPEAATAGQLLRAARIRAGVDLSALSLTLKVSVRQLQALEDDEHDPAKGPVFVRALAASVCRHLHADPAPILALLPKAASHVSASHLVVKSSIAHAELTVSRPASARVLTPQALWVAATMLALTFALIWLPAPSQWAWFEQVNAWFQSSSPESTTMVSEPESAPPVIVFPPPDALPQASEAVVVPSQVAAVAAPQPVSVVPVQSPAPSPSVAASKPELLFAASDTTWIEVRGGQNQLVWSGVLQAGESKSVQNSLPMNVTVGRANVVTVKYRGQAFDLKPHTKVTVARFEVKE